MLKIRILSVGKTKEDWLKAGIEEFEKRLGKTAEIHWILPKNDSQLEALAKEEKGLISLDPHGIAMSSKQFSDYLHERLIAQGSKVSFLIGGAEGIPSSIKQHSFLLSFSKMTFTHQMCRLILIEQIYRAFEIAKGTTYHK
jgi:23S rRNA (pseudouridine1915-N3)-methyltransferase